MGADFGNKNKKVNIGKGRDWGWILGEGTEEAYFRLPNRREPKDLFPLNVTLKTDKMGVEIFERGNHLWIILIFL